MDRLAHPGLINLLHDRLDNVPEIGPCATTTMLPSSRRLFDRCIAPSIWRNGNKRTARRGKRRVWGALCQPGLRSMASRLTLPPSQGRQPQLISPTCAQSSHSERQSDVRALASVSIETNPAAPARGFDETSDVGAGCRCGCRPMTPQIRRRQMRF